MAEGYTATPFLSWGDPLVSGLTDFDPATLTAEGQARRIGYNHDFVGFLPLPLGESNSDHGLLVINHEYTNPELMFPGYMAPNPAFATPVAEGEEEADEFIPAPRAENVDVEFEAHGIAVVEVQRDEMAPGAPARFAVQPPCDGDDGNAGDGSGGWCRHVEDRTDDTGTKVIGTLNNCSGGLTPGDFRLLRGELRPVFREYGHAERG